MRTAPATGSSALTIMLRAQHLRIGHHLIDGVDRPARHAGRLQHRQPFGGGPRLQRGLQLMLQRGMMAGAQVVLGEQRIGRQIVAADGAAQLGEQRLLPAAMMM